MSDRQITVTLGWLIVYGAWVAAFVIWGVSWAVGSDSLGELAVLIVAAAATATVRGYFIEHDRSVKNIITVLNLGDPGEDDGRRLRPMR